ncbi:MAG: hypothetical protein OXC00_15590 [Acidimicrobiaceae bacterium]|nr:hypothetical protein [Acidimicrobiaceae bacterium]
MSNNGRDPASAPSGGFRFTVRASDANVSISRPVSREDVDRVRRQLVEWATRRPAQPA